MAAHRKDDLVDVRLPVPVAALPHQGVGDWVPATIAQAVAGDRYLVQVDAAIDIDILIVNAHDVRPRR